MNLNNLATGGVKIAGALTKLYSIYSQLGPTAQASIAADMAAISSAWAAMDRAFENYTASSDWSKISAISAVIATIATVTPVIGKIANDGEMLFASDWPLIKPQIDVIVYTLKGNAT